MLNIYTGPISRTGRTISVPEYTQKIVVLDKRGESTYTLTFPQCLADLSEEERKEILQDVIIYLTKRK